MRSTVVYVHGNGNKPARDPLKSTWDRALLGEDAGARSRMAYWADLRYGAPLPDPDADASDWMNSVSMLKPNQALPADGVNYSQLLATRVDVQCAH